LLTSDIARLLSIHLNTNMNNATRSDRQRIVVIGATSAMAEHCLRLWLARGPADVTLVGRDVARLERVRNDLAVRSPASTITLQTCDFASPAAIRATVDQLCTQGAVDIALVAHGNLPDQSACEQDLALMADTLMVNATSPAMFAEALAGHMQARDHGTLAVIGSVAGDRGRKSNYVYGAAKGLVTRYVQGLQHRLAATRVKVVLIKPGPTSTPMTAHLQGQGPAMAPVESVAAGIVKAVDQGRPVAYVPGKWQLIMLVIRHLPSFIFNKMNI
jgi:decaprenylphospho-beta-D-erythro-pentofuranosid-2-ulose 2-reductase